MKKIIILGNGQLGSFLFKNWKLKNYIVDVIDYPQFDITNQKMIEDIVKKYDIIINAAAYTLVDQAQSKQLQCYNINSIGPMILTIECIKNNKKLIHISTEAVYGSNDLNYIPLKETDKKQPKNVYAKSKKLADQFIQNFNNENILILRPGWLFGPNSDHNFVEKIKKVILSKKEINVVTDQIGTMSYVGSIQKAIEEFLNDNLPYGTYNIGENGFPSRYDVACFVRDQIKSNCIINKCTSERFKRIANIGKNSCLNCTKIKSYVQLSNNWQDFVIQILNNN